VKWNGIKCVDKGVTDEQWCYLASRPCTRAAVEVENGGGSCICMSLSAPRGACDLLAGKFSCLYGVHRLSIAFLTASEQARNISME